MEDQKDSTSVDDKGQPQDIDKDEGAVKESVEGAGDEKVEEEKEAPTERTYSQEEFSKLQSKLDTQLKEAGERSATQMKELQDSLNAALEAADEARGQAFVRQVEENGGDVGAAKALVAREQAVVKQERDAKALQIAMTQQQVILNEAGKGKQALDLIKEHGLDESATEELLKATDPTVMENIALKLRLEKGVAEQRKPTKTDQSAGSDTKGRDLSQLPPSMVLGTLMEEAKKEK